MGLTGAAWRTSSYTGSSGGECVEAATRGGRVLIRDSKELADTQRSIVVHLDAEIDRLRVSAEPDDWQKFYNSLWNATGPAIDELLGRVTGHLKIGSIRDS